jgi:O-glycosyl hydrolase
MEKRRVWRLCGLAVVLAAVTAAALTITVDPTQRYQRIVGFGGSPNSANPASTALVSDLVSDAGVSVMRDDWCNNLDALTPYWNAGCHTMVASCWSPPASMKDNGSTTNGGHLLASKYDAFGTYTVQQLTAFRNAHGGELYAISPQNEPAFVEFYNSCVYEGADLTEVTKVIGRKIREAGLHTKIFLPEDVYDNWSNDGKYFGPLLQDSVATSYVSALAFHGYTANGITPAQMSAGQLGRMYTQAHSKGWELWQTENAGSKNLNYAYDVIACLRYGKVSMYMKFDIVAGNTGSDEYYIAGSTKNLTYYVAKCINRFVRPGAVQIRSFSPDSATFSAFVAFHDSAASALTVTLATAATAQTVTLAGANLPTTLQKWVANASTNCVNQGNVAPSSAISVPANSVVTLYGMGYTPPATSVKTPSSLVRSEQRAADRERVYDVGGRRVAVRHGSAAGLAVVVRGRQAMLRTQGGVF